MKKVIISIFLVFILRLSINMFSHVDHHIGIFLPLFGYQILFGFLGFSFLIYVYFFKHRFKKNLFYIFVSIVNLSSLIEIFITKTNNNMFYLFIGFIFLIGVFQFAITMKRAKFKQ